MHSRPITDNDIIGELVKPYVVDNMTAEQIIEKGFTLADINRVCEVFKPAFLKVYDITNLNKTKEHTEPVFERTDYQNTKMTSNRLPGFVLYIIDDHVYEQPVMIEGRGDKVNDIKNRAGIVYNPTVYKIFSSIQEALDDTTVTMAYVDSAENEVDIFTRQKISEGEIPNIHRHDPLHGEILEIYYNGKMIKWCYMANESEAAINKYNETSKHKLVFNGQSAHSLALTIGCLRDYLPESTLSPDVYNYFRSSAANIYGAIGWFRKEFIDRHHIYLDMVGCYAYAGENAIIPIISINDEFVQYKGETIFAKNLYIVHGPSFEDSACMFDGYSIYPGQVVLKGLHRKFITVKDIDQVLVVNKYNHAGQLTNHIRWIEESFGKNAKLVYNSMVGLAKTTSAKLVDNNYLYATTYEELASIIKDKDDYSVDVIYMADEKINRNVNTRSNKLFMKMEALDGNVVYSIHHNKSYEKLNNHLIFHNIIPKLANMYLAEHIIEMTGGNFKPYLHGISTDSIAIDPRGIRPSYIIKHKKDCERGEMGQYEGDFKFDITFRERRLYNETEKWRNDRDNYKIINELIDSFSRDSKNNMNQWYDLQTMPGVDISEWDEDKEINENTPLNKLFNNPKNLGLHIFGRAGRGKSYKTGQIVKHLLDCGKSILCLAPTHTARENLAMTIFKSTLAEHPVYTLHSALGYGEDMVKIDDRETLLNRSSKYDYIIIDEIFATPHWILAKLYEIKQSFKNTGFILVGDSRQLPPVEEVKLNTKNSSYIFKVCDNRYMEMTKWWRNENDPQALLLDEQQEIVSNGGMVDYNKFTHNECRMNICYTNRKRQEINKKWCDIECRGKKNYDIKDTDHRNFVGMPIIAKYNTKAGYKNGQRYTISSINSEFVTIQRTRPITNEIETYTLSHAIYARDFDPFYCITTHKSQGLTFSEPYSIHEWDYDNLPDGFLYTALTRGTKMANINLI
jgi:DNA replication protein DnaC